jgi:hypothetical protein
MNRKDGGREGQREQLGLAFPGNIMAIWRSYPAHSVGEWAMFILLFDILRCVCTSTSSFPSMPGY